MPELNCSPFFCHINANIREIKLSRVELRIAKNIHTAAGVISNGVLDSDLPIFDSGIHNFKAGDNALGRSQNIVFCIRGATER